MCTLLPKPRSLYQTSTFNYLPGIYSLDLSWHRLKSLPSKLPLLLFWFPMKDIPTYSHTGQFQNPWHPPRVSALTMHIWPNLGTSMCTFSVTLAQDRPPLHLVCCYNSLLVSLLLAFICVVKCSFFWSWHWPCITPFWGSLRTRIWPDFFITVCYPPLSSLSAPLHWEPRRFWVCHVLIPPFHHTAVVSKEDLLLRIHLTHSRSFHSNTPSAKSFLPPADRRRHPHHVPIPLCA